MIMKKLILLWTIVFSFGGYSQEWAPIGATWHYSEKFIFWNPIDEDYIKYESVKDTLINGINCKKIIKRHDVWCNVRPEIELMY